MVDNNNFTAPGIERDEQVTVNDSNITIMHDLRPTNRDKLLFDSGLAAGAVITVKTKNNVTGNPVTTNLQKKKVSQEYKVFIARAA